MFEARALSSDEKSALGRHFWPTTVAQDWAGVDRSGAEPVVSASCGEPWQFARASKGKWLFRTEKDERTAPLVGLLQHQGTFEVVVEGEYPLTLGATIRTAGDTATIEALDQGIDGPSAEFVPTNAGWRVVDDCEGGSG